MNRPAPRCVRSWTVSIVPSRGAVLATLIRLIGDFDLAEEALHEAFAAALEQWSRTACPPGPAPGSFRPAASRPSMQCGGGRAWMRHWWTSPVGSTKAASSAAPRDEELEDDRLRLIFTCCHPALSPSTQVALTLREVCGLATEEIASASDGFAHDAQRIVRGKAKIDARIPLSGAVAHRPPRTTRFRAGGHLPRLQRGVFRLLGRLLTRRTCPKKRLRLGRLLSDSSPIPKQSDCWP